MRPSMLLSADLSVPDFATGAAAPRLLVTEPLRVLHVFDHLGMGGTEYGVLRVIAGLNNGLFNHRLCTLRGFDSELVRQRNLADKLFVAGRPDASLQFPLFRLVAIMKAYRPHIVHSRNWGAVEAIPAARLARVPVAIHSEHGYEMEMLAGLPGRRRLLRRAVYAMADAVFTVTRDLRDFHARQAWVSTQRIRVIYNGVDTTRFSPRPQVCLRLREEFGWPAGCFVVGTVGRMVPLKDHGTLLKAAEILIRLGVDTRVLLVGSGPELARHQRYVNSSPELRGRTFFVGPSDRVAELLNVMDVFVLPSLCEGMSNTLLEAMASALPVAATRVGGNPELIEEDRSGWLFSPGDVEGLAERLRRLAHHRELRAQVGGVARERAIERFRLQRMLQDYQDLYLEMAERRGVLARS